MRPLMATLEAPGDTKACLRAKGAVRRFLPPSAALITQKGASL